MDYERIKSCRNILVDPDEQLVLLDACQLKVNLKLCARVARMCSRLLEICLHHLGADPLKLLK